MAERVHQLPKGREHALVSLAQECGQDVLADLLTPQVIPTVAAGQLGGVQVDPVRLMAAVHSITAGGDPLDAKLQAAFETGQIEGTDGVEIDERLTEGGGA